MIFRMRWIVALCVALLPAQALSKEETTESLANQAASLADKFLEEHAGNKNIRRLWKFGIVSLITKTYFEIGKARKKAEDDRINSLGNRAFNSIMSDMNHDFYAKLYMDSLHYEQIHMDFVTIPNKKGYLKSGANLYSVGIMKAGSQSVFHVSLDDIEKYASYKLSYCQTAQQRMVAGSRLGDGYVIDSGINYKPFKLSNGIMIICLLTERIISLVTEEGEFRIYPTDEFPLNQIIDKAQ